MMVAQTEENVWVQMALVSAIAKGLRSQMRVGRQWRRNAWETVYNGLVTCGAGMREAGPVDAKCYSLVADLAVEYLKEKKNRSPERIEELGRILRDDFRSFCFSEQRLEPFMTRHERTYVSEVRASCITNLLMLDLLMEELVSPDTG